ncbi:hypothetical protein SGR_2186 [Streptomyces griseus subsp. griseus NBRC 13350]|uniref:Large membrane protein n=1 Tax=Streptomyces griseus subsp. griseus (strain JCM 4626 / CBS 651.72 / NBRC 13350 / KCC S-0626 / ISP 5235) TaxID=455632 RepID=B1W0C6_STRGG|nr:hypothetical protein SGR_2186 [Streptomyces griseus subsp. griseus NBRC 13350]
MRSTLSTNHVPPRPRQAPANAARPPSTAPRVSEATRLLCTGTYLDAGYRDQVIDELYLSQERVVAPSFGFDAARVLAHALRARRVELAWAVAVVLLMVIGATVSLWLLVLVVPGLLMTIGKAIRANAGASPGYRRLPLFLMRWIGRLLLAYLVVYSVAQGLGKVPQPEAGAGRPTGVEAGSTPGVDTGSTPGVDTGTTQGTDAETTSDDDSVPLAVLNAVTPDIRPWKAWVSLGVLLALGACVAGQELHFVRVLRGELSRRGFASTAVDRAERFQGRRFLRVTRRIRLEQHSPLVMYHEAHPFCGAGTAQDPWVLAVELRPNGTRERRPLGNATVLAAMRPFIEQLREVAESVEGGGQAVRDRLRHLRIDECVLLPMEGLQHREETPYDRASFEAHRARAVEEGGEKRRHFLRVSVDGWEEGLVVTVFVRVHTQGRMLMLEIAPHALLPVRADFKDADHLAYRFADMNAFGRTVHIFTLVAGAPGQSLMTLGRHLVRGWRRLTGEADGAGTDGPALSVRELASEPVGSLFHRMDVDRYLKSVQDRIAYGVKEALSEAGYQTGEFAQKVVYITNGGVNIDAVVDSTFAIGADARATTSGARTLPRKGPDAPR